MADMRGYDALMHEVCVTWGFCGTIKGGQSMHVDLIKPTYGPVTADQFVEWVFLAEDMNPNAEPEKWARHKAGIRQAFIACMGSDVVNAEVLEWETAKD